MAAGTGYFHISHAPIESVINTPDEKPWKGGYIPWGVYTKPQGFWYSKNLAWLKVMESREFRRGDFYEPGLNTAVKASLCLISNVPNANTNDPCKPYPIWNPGAKLFVYRVKIPRWKKSYSPSKPDIKKILVLNSNTLPNFMNTLWNPYYNAHLIDCILNWIQTLSHPEVDMYGIRRLLTGFLEKIQFLGIPEEPWMTEVRKWNTEYEYDDKKQRESLDAIQEEMRNSIEILLKTYSDRLFNGVLLRKGGDLGSKWPLNEYRVEGMIWNRFWTEEFPTHFGGVEFDASIVQNVPSEMIWEEIDYPKEEEYKKSWPIWTRLLDVESGCIFRPRSMNIPLELLTVVGLDPISQTNVNYNVFGVQKGKVVRTSRKVTTPSRKNRRKTRKS